MIVKSLAIWTTKFHITIIDFSHFICVYIDVVDHIPYVLKPTLSFSWAGEMLEEKHLKSMNETWGIKFQCAVSGDKYNTDKVLSLGGL